MHRFTAAALLLALAVPPAFSNEADKVCPSIGEMAEKIMSARQSGTIMSTAMAAVPADNALRDLAIELVKRAYAVPQYSVQENRDQAVIKFRNDTELECYTHQPG